jgi:hypothetical protein
MRRMAGGMPGPLTLQPGPAVPAARLLQALFLFASAAVIFFNIIADVTIALVDPRIRV